MWMIISTLFEVWLVGLALLVWTGWGLGRLLTPAVLRPVGPLLTPFWGYAWTTILAYYLLWAGMALDQGRWIILGGATVLNGWAWLRTRRDGRPRALNWPELGLGAGLALLGGLLAVLPLFFHRQLAPLGSSWDVEFYLPLATYLRDYPYAQLSQAPANPLIHTIQADPTYARAIGFAYFHGLVDGLGGWPALRSFAPMLGLMRLLAAPAVFLFARYGLGLGRRGAALATLLVAANELLLWVQMTGFAMHASSMPLVPIMLLLTIICLRERMPRTTLGAIVLLAALTTSYHPALLGYGALACGAGLWYLGRGPQRLGLLGHGLALLGGAAALTWLVQARAGRAFFSVYAQGAPPLGTPGYITLRTLLGLTPLASAEAPAPPPWGSAIASAWPTLIWLACGLALALGALWLWRGAGERGLAAALLATAVVYAIGLRATVDFSYGYMKGLSFISFVPLTVIAAGIERLGAAKRRQPWPQGLALAGAALLLLVVGSTAWSSLSLLRADPGLYGRERLQLLELADHLPAKVPVFVSGAEELRGPTMGLIAYALREHPLLGRTATGYLVYDALPPGLIAPYGVLGPNDDPAEWGFGPQPLWRNRLAALYAGPPGRLAHLNGRPAAYSMPYPQALHRNTTLELALLGSGRQRTLDQPLDLSIGPASLQFGADALSASSPVSRSLLLAVGAQEPGFVRIEGGGISQTLALTPGLNLLASEPVLAPALLRISGSAAVGLRWIELYAPEDLPTPSAVPTLALSVATTPIAGGARISVQPAPVAQPLRMGLEIYEDSTEVNHYGWAVLPLTVSTLELDLAGRSLLVNGQPAAMNWGERGAGARRFFGAVWIYQGSTLLKRIPLLTFRDNGGEISTVEPLDANLAFVSLPQPATPAELQFGPDVRLIGTTITPARPGRTAQLSLWWQARGPTPPLMVTAQVLGAADRKFAQWDGLLGGDAAPSGAWQAGQIIRQDVPLALDLASPPGRQRLLVGVYAPDGAGLPASGPSSAPGGAGLLLDFDVLTSSP